MRRIEWSHIDAYRIKPANPQRRLLKPHGVTKDIIKAVLEVEKTDRDDTEVFARQFRPTVQGLHQLYWWIKMNIQYQEDPNGQQWVQTPSYLNESRTGDCKSYTVFICSVLWNMGLDYKIRFTTDNPMSVYVTHVYPIAVFPDGKEVVIDCVIGEKERKEKGLLKDYFNKEAKKYIEKNFFIKNGNMAEIYKLGNIGTEDIDQLIGTDLFPDIPDSIIHAGAGDVTQMTSGQVDRLILSERYDMRAALTNDTLRSIKYNNTAKAIRQGSISGISGISGPEKKSLSQFLNATHQDTAPAFQMPDVPGINGLGSKIKSWFNKQWKKVMNWLFKGPAKKMGPYFTFLWLNKRTPAIDKRRNEQYKTLNWIKKVGKFDDKKIKGLVINGCMEATGMTPPQLLRKAAGGKNVAIGKITMELVGHALKAVSWLVEIIQKIAKLFKKNKNDAGKIDESMTSDLRMVEEMVEEKKQTGDPKAGDNITKTPEDKDESNTAMMAAAAAAIFAAIAI